MNIAHFARHRVVLWAATLAGLSAAVLNGQTLQYEPYIQPGDNGPLGPTDQIVVAWRTSEKTANATGYTVNYGTTTNYGSTMNAVGRVVDNYLAADSNLPIPATAPGPQVNYTAVLTGLQYNTTYYYQVNGPTMPSGGFTASFHTRKVSAPFAFSVEGDEGYFPNNGADPAAIVNYEARIVHEIYNVGNLSVPNAPPLPSADMVIIAGDNVYNTGAESSMRDFWFPVWNNDKDSSDTGAPLARSTPIYTVAGNHDIGGNGDYANMLDGNAGGPFTGNSEGGDLMGYFNDYYYPLNGPSGVDSQYIFNGNASTPTGWTWSYQGKSYTTTAAASAYRASTAVNTGNGTKQQSDHMSNFSFDYGNAHFIFLDSNPHLFQAQVDYTAPNAAPQAPFSDYPSVLRDWVVNDLDSSSKPWKIAVFHHSPFSSGNGTIRNFQMRSLVKTLENHGVNIVFNGHEHNYQRTAPLVALPQIAKTPSTATEPFVIMDTAFDGVNDTVPDGIIYVVDGAGGNRDFDGNIASPRGQGAQLDQDDSATGTYNFGGGLTINQGPGTWLDIFLTNTSMAPFIPNAGAAPKITQKFKAKVFSFSHVVVNSDSSMSLYQVSEPLLSSSSATSSEPAPFGTDFQGKPLNDPLPDVLLNPTTGALQSQPSASGTPGLLDSFTITRPDLSAQLTADISAPGVAKKGDSLNYRIKIANNSTTNLNGVQVVVTLPTGVYYAGSLANATLVGQNQVVLTVGRLGAGETHTQVVRTLVSSAAGSSPLTASAAVRSSTAQPLTTNNAVTSIR
jgi:uncharacterized repeat protein (TIGR01451 family)